MFYRENGQFKTSYRADQQILPIRQDRIAMAVILLVAFVAVPALASDYFFRAILIPFVIMSLAALGVNVLVGYCGQISLGSGAFMAVGAYGAYNFFVRIPGMPLIPALILGGLCATFLVKTGLKNIAVFYQNDAYGKAGLAGVERALKKLNVPMLEMATVERNSTDVAKAVEKILPKRPDVIIQISAYASCSAYIKEMRKAGYTGQFYNVSFVGSKALADTLGAEGPGVVISQVVPFPWHLATPIVSEYTKAMHKAGIKDLNFSSLEGFIAAKIFVEGLKRAGKNLSRDRLISALESINIGNYDAGGFDIAFSPSNHNGSKYVDMTVISKDGKFRN